MYNLISPLKSRADIMKFAILLSMESVYDETIGRNVSKLNLEQAEKIYGMFDKFDIPDYEKPMTDDIIKQVVNVLKKEKDQD